jgi:allantoinase
MAEYQTIIRGGSVVRTTGIEEADIAIAEGKIVAIERDITSGTRSPREVDARDLTVFPGVIDSHVHFNDPGRAHWEGFSTGSSAFAAGGGTCFVDMPLNSFPPTLDGPSFDVKMAAAESASRTDFALYGGITPKNLDRLEELAERGVVGFKAFMCPSGIEDFPYAHEETLYRGMQTAAMLDLPVLLHAESATIVAEHTARVQSRGDIDAGAFAESRPVQAELEAIRSAIRLARETRCRVHIVHVSSAECVTLVHGARESDGVEITCETCPHYLSLNSRDLLEIGTRAKCAPPLRDEATRQALLASLLAGGIDTVGSDHSPAPPEIKEGSDFFSAWGGIAGVQTTLRVLLTLGVPPERIAALLAAAPARLLRLAGKDEIVLGSDADLVLVDTAVTPELTREDLLDRHRMSPFVGRRLRGAIRSVFLRGEPVNEKTRGRLVRPVGFRPAPARDRY